MGRWLKWAIPFTGKVIESIRCHVAKVFDFESANNLNHLDDLRIGVKRCLRWPRLITEISHPVVT